MSAKTALQVNAAVGLASIVVSAAMMSLLLTRPVQVASAVANRDVGAIVISVAEQLGRWLHALLRFL
jgi:hypothetical protein